MLLATIAMAPCATSREIDQHQVWLRLSCQPGGSVTFHRFADRHQGTVVSGVLMKVTALAIYPIKGCQGSSLISSGVELRGLEDDRRWMIVDASGRFITQREVPRLAQIKAETTGDGLVINLPGGAPAKITQPDGSKRATVRVWRSIVDAVVADMTVNESLSNFLERSVKLVFMDRQARRFSNPDWAGQDAPVSFADGYPILLTSTASLAALNSKIIDQDGDPVSMDRFRPNIVVEGSMDWEEDRWKVIKIGDLVFDAVKPCTRCNVPELDQRTGEARSDNQPTRALKSIRRSADKRVKGFLFGWNIIARASGSVRVGDNVQVLERREAWPIHTVVV